MDPRLAEVRGYVRATRDQAEARLREAQERHPEIVAQFGPSETDTVIVGLCDTLLAIASDTRAPVVHTEPLRFVAAGGAK